MKTAGLPAFSILMEPATPAQVQEPQSPMPYMKVSASFAMSAATASPGSRGPLNRTISAAGNLSLRSPSVTSKKLSAPAFSFQYMPILLPARSLTRGEAQ